MGVLLRLLGKPQYMSKFKKSGTVSFCSLLKLSQVLTLPDENYKTIMRDFCLKVDTTELIKQSFEYASITRDIELLKRLIGKYRKDKGVFRSLWMCMKYCINI